jgi:hypothetical protein
MEVHSSVSRVTTLQAGRPLSSGVLQLKLTANLEAVAQLSICEAVFPLLHMPLWHYKNKQKKKAFCTSQNFIFKYKFTKLCPLKNIVFTTKFYQKKSPSFHTIYNISEVYEP